MNIKIRDDFDDEDRDLFARCGRVYQDLTPVLRFLQLENINPDPDMHDDVLVLATKKWDHFPTGGSPMLITNFSTDRRPYNEVGNVCGQGWLIEPEKVRETIWRR